MNEKGFEQNAERDPVPEKKPIQLKLTAEERANLINALKLLECGPDLRGKWDNPFPHEFHNEKTGTITPTPNLAEVLEILRIFKNKLISLSESEDEEA